MLIVVPKILANMKKNKTETTLPSRWKVMLEKAAEEREEEGEGVNI